MREEKALAASPATLILILTAVTAARPQSPLLTPVRLSETSCQDSSWETSATTVANGIVNYCLKYVSVEVTSYFQGYRELVPRLWRSQKYKYQGTIWILRNR